MAGERTIRRTAAEEAILERFGVAGADLPGNDAVAGWRRTALDAFAEKGLPTRRVEAWKYTDLKRLMTRAAPIAAPVADATAVLGHDPLEGVERHRLVFVNGRYSAELSDAGLPEGVKVMTVAEALASGDAAIADALAEASAGLAGDAAVSLNSAFLTDGAVIRIAPKAKIEKPIELAGLFAGDEAGAVALRHLVLVGADASADIVESWFGPDVAYETNALTALVLGAGARLGYTRLQAEGAAAVHLGTIAASIAASASLELFNLMLGAAVSRAQLFLAFEGEGGNADVRGATLGAGRQHADVTMMVDHAVPHCTSSETLKAVVGGEARAVFQGNILVRQHAQHTDARMMLNALLRSPDAEFDAKPELEIYADDVQCAHGATSGALDENLLFYLLSRGIPRAEAEELLIVAFLGQVLAGISNEAVAGAATAMVEAWLAAGRGAK
ncbi:MAG: Fe-S cluster assembly protein SufD [Hyphomicrobiales bacterium]